MTIDITDKINSFLEKRQDIDYFQRQNEHTKTVDENGESNKYSLATGLKPSKFLPLRTALYWQDVEMSKLPVWNFFKMNSTSVEIHDNATEGFGKVVDISSFHQVLKETSFELSYSGESDIAIYKQGLNMVPLKIDLINKQYFPNGSLMFYHGITNFDTGTAPWIMTKKFYYDKEDNVIMENEAYEPKDSDNGRTWNVIHIDKFNKKYNQDFVGTINLGKVEFPVVTLTNTGADRWGTGRADWDGIQDVLARLDIVEDAIDRSIKTSKTRLYSKKKNSAMDLVQDGGGTTNAMARQIYDDVEHIEITEDPHLDENGNLQVVDRDLKVDQWYAVRKSLMNEYMSFTGENIAADAHGNNQHTYEVQSRGDNKYRRAEAKKEQREKDITNVINIIMSMAKSIGIKVFSGVDVVSVKITETDIRKEFELEDKVEKLLNLGLISKVQALMKLESIDELTAMVMLAAKEKHDKIFEEEPEEVPLPTNEEQEVIVEDEVSEPTEED